jgi:hypothetical protein
MSMPQCTVCATHNISIPESVGVRALAFRTIRRGHQERFGQSLGEHAVFLDAVIPIFWPCKMPDADRAAGSFGCEFHAFLAH